MRSDKRGKLEKAMDELANVGEKTGRDVQDRLNESYLVEFRESDAPDLKDYPEDEIDQYLIDLHEWALERYAERVAELKEATDIDIDAYPPLGHDRPSDREERETQHEQIVDAAEVLARVDVARDRLEQIEDEWSER